jgi:type I restriction enzyme S subunit
MNVLLSIKPKFVEEIKKGNKKYEFRKTIFKKDVDKVFIYCSSPVQKIIGYFSIADIIEGSPDEIWECCKEDSGIDETDFFIYFKNKDTGYAIEIKELELFDPPKDPKTMNPEFRPPQSYYYINNNRKSIKPLIAYLK